MGKQPGVVHTEAFAEAVLPKWSPWNQEMNQNKDSQRGRFWTKMVSTEPRIRFHVEPDEHLLELWV